MSRSQALIRCGPCGRCSAPWPAVLKRPDTPRYALLVPDQESAMQAHRRRAIPPNRPLDLFSTSLSTIPSWERLPARTRQAVTTLLARMLLAHARGPSQEPGSDTDER